MSFIPSFRIHSFEPVQLTVENIGPFRDRVQSFGFLHHELNEPCNFYLFISQNGYGKTTLLELMATLMGMLGQREPQPFGFEPLDKEGGRAAAGSAGALARYK